MQTRGQLDFSQDLIKAFSDPRVCEALIMAVKPALALVVETVLATKLDELNKANTVLNQRLEKCELELLKQRELNDKLNARISGLDSYSRKPNLVITGLKVENYAEAASTTGQTSGTPSVHPDPWYSTDSTVKSVLKLFNQTLGVSVVEQDISAAHRLPVKNSGGSGATSLPPPIIVRFSTLRIRDKVYAARKSLKDLSIYINEHLCPEAKFLFNKARDLLKQKRLSNVWTFNGNVFVKRSTDTTETPKKICSTSDLANF